MRPIAIALASAARCLPPRRCLSGGAGGGGVADSLRALINRGCFQTVLPLKSEKHLDEYLDSGRASGGRHFYCGFDPTANSLHLGNLLAVAGLLRLRALRQHVIFLVGGATARIGDPTDRTADRAQLSDLDVAANARAISRQLQGIIDNHARHFCCGDAASRLGEALVLNNQTWHEDLSAAEFLSSHMSGMRLHDLLNKHTVQARINSKHGMSVKEFMYPLFQAFDWLHLYRKYGCLIQVGGNDQIGNIDTGLVCLNRSDHRALGFGLTVPLLTTSDGHKLGKTEQLADTVWLSADKTSPYAIYQRLRSTADADVGRMLRLFTFLTDRQVADLCERHAASPENYEAQIALADGVTLLLHGEAGLSAARKWTRIIFAEDAAALASLTESDVSGAAAAAAVSGLQHPQQQQQVSTLRLPWCDGVSLRSLLLQELKATTMTSGQLEAALAAGRVTVNLRPPESADAPLVRTDCALAGCGATLIKLGRRNFLVVKWDA